VLRFRIADSRPAKVLGLTNEGFRGMGVRQGTGKLDIDMVSLFIDANLVLDGEDKTWLCWVSS
jgi:hypothetical protein